MITKVEANIAIANDSRWSKESATDTAPRRTLLVVEDEVLVGLQLAMLMENLGWSIIGPANSLEEADALLAGEETLDAAILDVNLDGTLVFPLADILHRRGVPILFHTAYETLVEAERFEGCVKLSKPAGVNQIVARIKALTDDVEPLCA